MKSTPWIVLTMLAFAATLLGGIATLFDSRFALAWPLATSLLWFRGVLDAGEDRP